MSARVVHFEIPFDDSERAGTFYSSVFGWDVVPMPQLDYVMVASGPAGDQGPTEPGYINGGMFKRAEPFSGPTVVMAVDDIDATLKTVEEAGGTVVQGREPVGEMGFAAYLRDTEGNLVGLWENA